MYPYGNQSFMISQHNFDYPLKSDDYKAIYLRQDDCIPKMITKNRNPLKYLSGTYETERCKNRHGTTNHLLCTVP